MQLVCPCRVGESNLPVRPHGQLVDTSIKQTLLDEIGCKGQFVYTPGKNRRFYFALTLVFVILVQDNLLSQNSCCRSTEKIRDEKILVLASAAVPFVDKSQ